MLKLSDLTFEFKENENLLFHYTNYFNALSIGIGNKLWANQLSQMNDPLEFRALGQHFSLSGEPSREEISNKSEELYKANKKRNDTVRLLSFSVDDFHFHDNVFSKQVTFCNNLNHGWARTRMWTQYANNHKGVCLIFDKEKILNATSKLKDIQYYEGKINYSNDFHKFEDKMDVDFSLSDFQKDYSNYFMQDDKIQFLFQKCDDFMAEQKYRLLFVSNYFKKDKPFIFDFEDSLCGIIFSDKFDENNYETLKKLSNIKNIPVFHLQWDYGMPRIYNWHNCNFD